MTSKDLRGHRQVMQSLLHDLCGDASPTGLELMRQIKMTANHFDAAVDEGLRVDELSGPRLGLLLYVMAAEAHGEDPAGISPTDLSQRMRVTKNTTSALLRGLEEQGLIERTLDPDDHRAFRIRVSAAGRDLLTRAMPGHLAYLNRLVSGLDVQEQAELIRLLTKLQNSLEAARGTRCADPLRSIGRN